MAFDRHMNLVLGDSEEYRKVPPRKGGEEVGTMHEVWPCGMSTRMAIATLPAVHARCVHLATLDAVDTARENRWHTHMPSNVSTPNCALQDGHDPKLSTCCPACSARSGVCLV